MFDPKILDDIANRISALVPDNVAQVEANIKQQIKNVLSNIFDQLDLVTREEFDVQKKVLERTRQKVDELEQTIKALEKQHKR